MKKLILVAIALIGFTTTSHAQSFKFGFKGGLNFATINGDGIDADSRTGYHLGAVGQIGVGPLFAIQPEILYSAQGAKDFDIDYLNVPILVKLKFAKFLSVEAGPQFGFVVNDDIKSGGEPESFDMSAAIGAGVEFSKFFAQLRYNIGLTDVTDGGDIKNSAFQVSVGYYIF
ncbi:porin family protein [Aquimarina addita]|uniref:Porin family protein n=1 Tax=Aquimarina addita TaxID=870485 RepID=A0ABP7XFL6_9FLAO